MRHVSPEPNSGCWLWLGCTYGQSGYGGFQVGSRTDNSTKNQLAHRVAHELFIGPIPHGLYVLHKCDTRLCVNPDHLFAGTNQKNCSDMAIKGRGVRSKRGFPFGVMLDKSNKRNPFVAKVQVRGECRYLGSFRTAVEAGMVAAEYRKKAHIDAAEGKVAG